MKSILMIINTKKYNFFIINVMVKYDWKKQKYLNRLFIILKFLRCRWSNTNDHRDQIAGTKIESSNRRPVYQRFEASHFKSSIWQTIPWEYPR